jgi:hypothetical protein
VKKVEWMENVVEADGAVDPKDVGGLEDGVLKQKR